MHHRRALKFCHTLFFLSTWLFLVDSSQPNDFIFCASVWLHCFGSVLRTSYIDGALIGISLSLLEAKMVSFSVLYKFTVPSTWTMI